MSHSRSLNEGPLEGEPAKVKEAGKNLDLLPSPTIPYIPWREGVCCINLDYPDINQIPNSLGNSQIPSVPLRLMNWKRLIFSLLCDLTHKGAE